MDSSAQHLENIVISNSRRKCESHQFLLLVFGIYLFVRKLQHTVPYIRIRIWRDIE